MIHSQASINLSYVKVRWQEPYSSAGLNAKTFGVTRPGVYEGFTINPGTQSGRDIVVGPGSVSGNVGSGFNVGYVSGSFDSGSGYSIAVYEDPSGFNTTVQIPPGVNSQYHLDATGQEGKRLYIVLSVMYAITQTTSAVIDLVDASDIDANPWYVVLGYVDVPSSVGTPLDAADFGYNDPKYPRLTPLSTPTRAGLMPPEVWSMIGSNTSPWQQNLLVTTVDPNNALVLDITPSQWVEASGVRIFSYVQAAVASRFPRDASGNYNGGVSNTSLTKLNLETGVIGGAHEIPTNLTFPTPSVSGTPNAYQVGIIALDPADNLSVTYGAIYTSVSGALLDSNLPIVGSTVLQIAGFLVSTDVSGNVLGLLQSDIMDRRPFLNVGGGGSGGASVLSIDYATQFDDSIYQYMNTSVFATDGSTFVDSSSTGTFDLVANEFSLPVAGEHFLSKQNLCTDFLSQGIDVSDVYLMVNWDPALIDEHATYELSRDGGVSFQSVSGMVQINGGDTFVGRLFFSNTDALSTLSTYAISHVNSELVLNTSVVAVSEPFTLSNAAVIEQVQFQVTKVGSPGGNLQIQVIKDNGSGKPSSLATDILIQSQQMPVTSFVSGSQTWTETLSAPGVVPSGNYHLVISSDSVYQAGFVSGSSYVELGINNSSPSAPTLLTSVSGTWTAASPAEAMAYVIQGRSLDLRVKITSGTSSVKLAGYAVLYGPNGQVQSQKLEQQTISVTNNQNTIQLTNFLPNPNTLKIFWVERALTFVYPAFSVDGQYVTFPANTFNVNDASITLVCDQTSGGAVDTSDANAAQLATNSARLDSLGTQLSPMSVLDTSSNLISVPHTQVVNRKQIVDPSNSLGAHMGINRIVIEGLSKVLNESGPAGEPVFSVIGDTYDRIRFVGSYFSLVYGTTYGNYVQNLPSGSGTGFCEITFYGTGLNILQNINNTANDLRATVDGGIESGDLIPANTSNVTAGTGYATYQVINAAKGLSLGVHTVKIRCNANYFTFYGFEILNESASIKVAPGTYYSGAKKLTLSSLQSLSYNSGFTSGTLGTKGGRASLYLLYQNGQTVLQSALNPVDVTAQYASSANHSNEELLYHLPIRAFGSMGSADFSNVSSGTLTNPSFTLSDGSTILYASNANYNTATGPAPDGFYPTGVNDYFVITFVGTGLDLLNTAPGTVGGTYSYVIDGVTQASGQTGMAHNSWIPICSGLPYGTHTVQILETVNSGASLVLSAFRVWGTKKPLLPSGAIEIADYFVMANYTANATADTLHIAQGVLRKHSTRELVYTGSGWAFGNSATFVGGKRAITSTSGDAFQYTFEGTGFEWRQDVFTGDSATIALTLNGVALSTANFTISLNGGAATGTGPAINVTTYGGPVFTPSSGNLSLNSSSTVGTGFTVSGLTFGTYTFSAVNGSAASMMIHSFDVITPIHSPKKMTFSGAMETMIGSQGINDDRQTQLTSGVIAGKGWAKAVGVTASATTTSTSLAPMPDMAVLVNVQNDNATLRMSHYVSQYISGTVPAGSNIQFVLDGVLVGTGEQINTISSGQVMNGSMIERVPVSKGIHLVQVYWAVGTGTGTVYQNYRTLLVEEE